METASLLRCGEAAVDAQDLAGDERGSGGAEEDRRANEDFRFAATTVELHDPVPVRARVFLGLVEDLAGATADGVDDDVDVPKPADRFLDRAFGLGLDRHVAADRQAL